MNCWLTLEHFFKVELRNTLKNPHAKLAEQKDQQCYVTYNHFLQWVLQQVLSSCDKSNFESPNTEIKLNMY